jgi:hypothetical protein
MAALYAFPPMGEKLLTFFTKRFEKNFGNRLNQQKQEL